MYWIGLCSFRYSRRILSPLTDGAGFLWQLQIWDVVVACADIPNVHIHPSSTYGIIIVAEETKKSNVPQIQSI